MTFATADKANRNHVFPLWLGFLLAVAVLIGVAFYPHGPILLINP
jgi:hypothetical protein